MPTRTSISFIKSMKSPAKITACLTSSLVAIPFAITDFSISNILSACNAALRIIPTTSSVTIIVAKCLNKALATGQISKFAGLYPKISKPIT